MPSSKRAAPSASSRQSREGVRTEVEPPPLYICRSTASQLRRSKRLPTSPNATQAARHPVTALPKHVPRLPLPCPAARAHRCHRRRRVLAHDEGTHSGWVPAHLVIGDHGKVGGVLRQVERLGDDVGCTGRRTQGSVACSAAGSPDTVPMRCHARRGSGPANPDAGRQAAGRMHGLTGGVHQHQPLVLVSGALLRWHRGAGGRVGHAMLRTASPSRSGPGGTVGSPSPCPPTPLGGAGRSGCPWKGICTPGGEACRQLHTQAGSLTVLHEGTRNCSGVRWRRQQRDSGQQQQQVAAVAATGGGPAPAAAAAAAAAAGAHANRW